MTELPNKVFLCSEQNYWHRTRKNTEVVPEENCNIHPDTPKKVCRHTWTHCFLLEQIYRVPLRASSQGLHMEPAFLEGIKTHHSDSEDLKQWLEKACGKSAPYPHRSKKFKLLFWQAEKSILCVSLCFSHSRWVVICIVRSKKRGRYFNLVWWIVLWDAMCHASECGGENCYFDVLLQRVGLVFTN